MRVLITGHKGFVGTATTNYLTHHGDVVFGYDIMEGNDIRDAKRLKEFCTTMHVDRILHLAAVARFTDADNDPRSAFETNVLGTKNVARVASELRIPVVYASTGSVYMPIDSDPPIMETDRAVGNSVYGCTKRLGEIYIASPGNPYIILRYAHLYGAEKRMHGLIGGFMDRINRGLAPTLYGGKQSNDFTYILDVARANFVALHAPWDAWNQIYNIGTGEELTAEQAGKMVCTASGYTGEIKKVDMRGVDPMRFAFSVTKAEKQLGFKAEYNFKKGLKHMFSSLQTGEEDGKVVKAIPSTPIKRKPRS